MRGKLRGRGGNKAEDGRVAEKGRRGEDGGETHSNWMFGTEDERVVKDSKRKKRGPDGQCRRGIWLGRSVMVCRRRKKKLQEPRNGDSTRFKLASLPWDRRAQADSGKQRDIQLVVSQEVPCFSRPPARVDEKLLLPRESWLSARPSPCAVKMTQPGH